MKRVYKKKVGAKGKEDGAETLHLDNHHSSQQQKQCNAQHHVIIITLQLSSPLHFSVFSVVPSAVQHLVGLILSTAQGQVTPDPLLSIHTDL